MYPSKAYSAVPVTKSRGKAYRLFVPADEDFPELLPYEYCSVILRRPDVRWKNGTLSFGGSGSARTWAELNEELDAPAELFARA